MQTVKCAAFALGVLAFGSSAQAANVYVMGDSIGEGVAIASARVKVARISIHIRGNQVLPQFNSVPNGSTAILVLGTNDAEGSLNGLEKYIDNIVHTADEKQIKLIWIGPPCVRKAWDKNGKDLDALLASYLAKTSVKYVSSRDDAICSGRFQDRDGVHMKMAGYRHLWNLGRVAAGLPDDAPGSDNKRIQLASVEPTVPVRNERKLRTAAKAERMEKAPDRVASIADTKARKPKPMIRPTAQASSGDYSIQTRIIDAFSWFHRN